MATVTIDGSTLVVRLEGWQAAFALKRQISVSLSNVVSVKAGTLTSKVPHGLRLPGTYVPGVITAGSYWWKDRGWSFWSVRHEESAIDIRVRDEHYNRLVIEVEDARATSAMIDAAVRECEGSPLTA